MKRIAIKDFCTAFIALVVGIVKDVCFGLWGMIWVWIDEIKKALNSISGLEFAKIIIKAMLYSLYVVAWIILFYGIILIGWATL